MARQQNSPYRYSPPYTGIEYNFLDMSSGKPVLVTEIVNNGPATEKYGPRIMRMTLHNDDLDVKILRMHTKMMLKTWIRMAELEEEGKLPPPPEDDGDDIQRSFKGL